MSHLLSIPIRVELPVRSSGLGGGLRAVLSELVSMLERLSADGSSCAIDLRSLPMSPEDRSALQNYLGFGEVQATFRADGETSLRETKLAGIWWVEHRGTTGDLVAELLEVARVPAILQCASDELTASAHELRKIVESMSHATR